MVVPGVESVIVTACAPVYVPVASEKVGVAVCVAVTTWLNTLEVLPVRFPSPL